MLTNMKHTTCLYQVENVIHFYMVHLNIEWDVCRFCYIKMPLFLLKNKNQVHNVYSEASDVIDTKISKI